MTDCLAVYSASGTTLMEVTSHETLRSVARLRKNRGSNTSPFIPKNLSGDDHVT